jgi:putative transposase
MKNQLAKPLTKSSSHAVYSIRLHIVFVTKYRRKVISPEMLIYLDKAFAEILTAWNCELIEFGGEEDHVHLLISIKPALNISVLVNNLKTASARRVRNKFRNHIANFYWKPMIWHRAYFVGSVGEVSLETVRQYIGNQGTTERPPR